MVFVRVASVHDLKQMQCSDLWCHPDYSHAMKYLALHIVEWPQLVWIAEDSAGAVVGCVVGKLVQEPEDTGGSCHWQPLCSVHGHITSLSVLSTHRKQGIASALMRHAHNGFEKLMAGAAAASTSFVSLHVRPSNQGAVRLYANVLGYEVFRMKKCFFANGEDAFEMRCILRPPQFNPLPMTVTAIVSVNKSLEMKQDAGESVLLPSVKAV